MSWLKCMVMAAMCVTVVWQGTSIADPPRRAPLAGTQPANRDGPPLLDQSKEILSSLKLTDDQREKVEGILRKAREDFSTMRHDLAAMEQSQRMQQVRDFMQGVRKDVETVLNDEQKAAFAKQIEEMRQKFTAGERGAVGRNSGGRAAELGERLRENLAKLDLSDAQKAKVKELLDATKEKAQKLRQQAAGNGDEMRIQIQELMRDTREKMGEILTSPQVEKLKQLMGGGEGKRPTPPSPAQKPTTAPGIGQSAPDVQLRKLDGSAIELASFKGHVLVLEFGSYTSPSFRQRVAGMEQLKRDLGARASFLVVYTKEAHPAGEWEVERNKSEEIVLEQHKDAADRKAAANKARQTLKITMPIVLDAMDDAAAKSAGAGENSLLVIARDGTVAARQEWAEPYAARRLIEETLNSSATTKPVTEFD